MIKNKKIILFGLFFCLAFLLGGFLKVQAAAVSGYLWGGSEEISDGVINGNETGVGWIDVSSIDVPLADGPVTGYGWSENIGWVNFSPAGPYPVAPNNSVQRVGNDLVGWARIVSIADASAVGNSGGWLGWIKMINVTIDPVTGNMSGFAWSDELGWIDFSGASIIACADTCINPSCADPNDCGAALPRICLNPCNPPAGLCAVNNCGNAPACPACPEIPGDWKEVAPN